MFVAFGAVDGFRPSWRFLTGVATAQGPLASCQGKGAKLTNNYQNNIRRTDTSKTVHVTQLDS